MSYQATVRLYTVLAVICASTALASTRTSSSSTKANSTVAAASSPVAFVYLSSTLVNSNSSNHING